MQISNIHSWSNFGFHRRLKNGFFMKHFFNSGQEIDWSLNKQDIQNTQRYLQLSTFVENHHQKIFGENSHIQLKTLLEGVEDENYSEAKKIAKYFRFKERCDPAFDITSMNPDYDQQYFFIAENFKHLHGTIYLEAIFSAIKIPFDLLETTKNEITNPKIQEKIIKFISEEKTIFQLKELFELHQRMQNDEYLILLSEIILKRSYKLNTLKNDLDKKITSEEAAIINKINITQTLNHSSESLFFSGKLQGLKKTKGLFLWRFLLFVPKLIYNIAAFAISCLIKLCKIIITLLTFNKNLQFTQEAKIRRALISALMKELRNESNITLHLTLYGIFPQDKKNIIKFDEIFPAKQKLSIKNELYERYNSQYNALSGPGAAIRRFFNKVFYLVSDCMAFILTWAVNILQIFCNLVRLRKWDTNILIGKKLQDKVQEQANNIKQQANTIQQPSRTDNRVLIDNSINMTNSLCALDKYRNYIQNSNDQNLQYNEFLPSTIKQLLDPSKQTQIEMLNRYKITPWQDKIRSEQAFEISITN